MPEPVIPEWIRRASAWDDLEAMCDPGDPRYEDEPILRPSLRNDGDRTHLLRSLIYLTWTRILIEGKPSTLAAAAADAGVRPGTVRAWRARHEDFRKATDYITSPKTARIWWDPREIDAVVQLWQAALHQPDDPRHAVAVKMYERYEHRSLVPSLT